MSKMPLLNIIDASTLVKIVATGAWTSSNAADLEQALNAACQSNYGSRSIEVAMANVTSFDSYGAWLLERFRREMMTAGNPVAISGLGENNQPLFEEMADVNLRPARKVRVEGRGNWLEVIGFNIISLGRELIAFSTMLGAIISAFARILVRPGRFRFTSAVFQFDRVGWQALPIVLLVTFIVGAIIAQQGFFHFRRFGADLYVVDMVGFLVMREIGVLLVAIMVAGRSGSSYTAELGSMKMREEIDALRAMGFDPVEVLVLPRTLVLIIAMPALTFLGSIAALFGAGLVATYYGGLNPELFIDRLREAISLDHFKVGMIKAPFIGALIGVIACTEGFQVRGSSTSLGQHTTNSVVKSIFMVIVLDGLFAVFFTLIGM